MTNPFEAYLRNNTLPEKPLTADEEELQKKYSGQKSVMVAGIKKHSMADMDAFAEIYEGGKRPIIHMIDRDKKWILDERKKDGQKEVTERADLWEKIFEDMVENNEWLGENAYIAPTTEFDDRKNGTDFIVEWDTEDGRLPKLAVDCTVSEDLGVLQEKFDKSLDGIVNRHMTRIKYFQSSKSPDEKGPIDMIPRIVVFIKKDQMDNLCHSIKKDEANNHFIQLQLLLEIRRQLQRQLAFVKREKQTNRHKRFAEKRKEHNPAG